jgi:biotin transport system substrate-specific component
MGAPMFGNMNGGIAYLIGPVGGYYLGMFFACSTMPYLREKFSLPNLYNCLYGQILIYLPGILWLSQFIGLEASIYKGFIVYIPSGTGKIALLVGCLKIIKK